MKNLVRLFCISTIILAIVGSITGCNFWLADTRETETNYFERYYEFNPSTIMEVLNQGEKDVFVILDADPTSRTPANRDSTLLKSDDYMRIAEVLQKQAWGEEISGASIFSLSYTMNCSSVDDGLFSDVDIVSFQLKPSNQVITRTEYHTFITAEQKWASINKGDYTPNYRNLKPIAFNEFKISASDAVKIAEQSGGYLSRIQNDNKCLIEVISTGSKNSDWEVTYSKNSNGKWYILSQRQLTLSQELQRSNRLVYCQVISWIEGGTRNPT